MLNGCFSSAIDMFWKSICCCCGSCAPNATTRKCLYFLISQRIFRFSNNVDIKKKEKKNTHKDSDKVRLYRSGRRWNVREFKESEWVQREMNGEWDWNEKLKEIYKEYTSLSQNRYYIVKNIIIQLLDSCICWQLFRQSF